MSVNKLTVAPGELVTLCFKAKNATNYDVGRLRMIAKATPDLGCFADNPKKTTTYVVKVNGPGGEDSEKVTVTVK